MTNAQYRDYVSRDPKTVVLADILREHRGAPPSELLVVGCGDGQEAAALAQRLEARVTGIDIDSRFDPEAASFANLQRGDATRMAFDDETFDFVYSFHALEHIPDYRGALHEIHRVLKPSGGYMIGTPNRNRLIGYLGSRDATLRDKVRWNMADLSAKMAGRFRNEHGAHAGYSSKELEEELRQIFTTAIEITPEYYARVYSRQKALVSALFQTNASQWLVPAIYFYGER